ncbi:MAG: DUF413 domain-containing protein [Gammaproteobacteria bacterium]|nr:DUF413 domain-containing protein [Gammaproteobacteria bacterium]
MSINNFSSGIKFCDNDNFTYQFSRSGDFSIDEANILTECGYVMKKLEKREMRPENEEQCHFVGVIEGLIKPLYRSEFVYLKYLDIIEKKKSVICSIIKVDKYGDGVAFYDN